MCLYPKLIKNKKYTKNKKNGGVIPAVSDNRVLWVTAACGKCFECRKQKARAWQVRMSEELRENPNAIFVTLTISDESFEYIMDKYQIETNDECCKKMIRLFLERIRKETKKSIKHWFITEIGHDRTERYHLHGIMWGIGIDEIIKRNWKYGFVFIGSFVNEQTINYVVKYMLKKDKDHKEYNPTVLCSAGIGAGYINRQEAKNNKFRGIHTKETYTLRNGTKLNLPIYYRNKIYTEEEREQLFIQKIDKGYVWICGEKVDINDQITYQKILEYHQKEKQRLHGDDPQEWEVAKYMRRLDKQRQARKRTK
jgi:hypothetical protein